MNRRLGGLAMIVVVVLLIAVAGAVTGVDPAGIATRSPPAEPPPLGSCGVTRDGVLRVVPCSRRHTLEVTATWRAGSASPPPGYATCRGAARDYVGAPPAGDPAMHPIGAWTLPLRYGHGFVAGPSDVLVDGWSWRACVVRPIVPAPENGYQGSVRADVSVTRPGALRACFADVAALGVVVACTAEHAAELIATQAVKRAPGSAASTEDAVAGCASAVRSTTGAADPTYRGGLDMRVLPDDGDRLRRLSADTGVYFTAYGEVDWLLCVVESTRGPLVDTVAGLGDDPLPVG